LYPAAVCQSSVPRVVVLFVDERMMMVSFVGTGEYAKGTNEINYYELIHFKTWNLHEKYTS
jgi:hypothetical protein